MTLNKQNLTKEDLITILEDREAEFKDSKAEYEVRIVELKTSIQKYVNQQNSLRERRIEAESRVRKLDIESLRNKIYIEELKVGAECHLEALDIAKEWRLRQIKSKDDVEELNKIARDNLNREIADKTKEVRKKTEKLEKLGNELEDKSAENKELKRQLKEKTERLEKTQNELEIKTAESKEMEKKLVEKEGELHLFTKELPHLPKKKINLKKLGLKIKDNFQKLTKREKVQNQKIVAQVEVRTK